MMILMFLLCTIMLLMFALAYSLMKNRRENLIDNLISERNGFWEKFNEATVRADKAELKRDLIKKDWEQLARHYNELIEEHRTLQRDYDKLHHPLTPPLQEGITHDHTEQARANV